jgi:hypothetical protein
MSIFLSLLCVFILNHTLPLKVNIINMSARFWAQALSSSEDEKNSEGGSEDEVQIQRNIVGKFTHTYEDSDSGK